jgi:regulator of replication initiation timing
MKGEIERLKGTLANCEHKWNKIVKQTIRENVALKEENRRLKE